MDIEKHEGIIVPILVKMHRSHSVGHVSYSEMIDVLQA